MTFLDSPAELPAHLPGIDINATPDNSLIECVCGKARTGDPVSNGSLYYRCTDRLSKYPLERECHENGINVPVFDSLVWQNIKELLLNPQLVVAQAQRRQAASPLQNQLDTS